MKKYFYIILFAIAMVSCKPSEITKFGEERFIYFHSDKGLEYNYSFLYSEGRKEVEIKLPLKYAGKLYDSEKEYKLTATDKSTAKEGVDFRLPESTLFKSSVYEDTVSVTLIHTPAIDTKILELELELVANENFESKMKDAQKYKITFTNLITQPSWWDQDVIDFYLGVYSDKKFELFVKNVLHDKDYGAMDPTAKRAYAIAFKGWLAAHPDQAVDNGTLITVPV